MSKHRFIIQMLNKQRTYWFDYISFYEKESALHMYTRLKKVAKDNKNINIRFIEVIQVDCKKY